MAKWRGNLPPVGTMLMRSNWRPHDGIVARLINKHISVRISVLLVHLPFVTPNVISVAAALVAVAGMVLAARGDHWSFFLGATLLQIQSILDGCDGEIARLRYLSSRLGAWLDTAIDDVLGVAWVAALSLGAANATGWAWIATLGLCAAALYTVALSLIYTIIIRAGHTGHEQFRWWFQAKEPAGPARTPDPRRVSTWVTYALRRDFYVLLFWIIAAFGAISFAALLAAAGAVGWFVAAVIHVLRHGLRSAE